MKAKSKKSDFVDELEAMLPKERAERAKNEARKEIFKIKLAELREKAGIRQQDITKFSQSSISKLESRKDIKISTLLDYLESINMGIEIKVFPKKKRKKASDEIILLKA